MPITEPDRETASMSFADVWETVAATVPHAAALVHGDRMAFAAFDAVVRSWLPARDPRRGLALLLDATLPLQARPA